MTAACPMSPTWPSSPRSLPRAEIVAFCRLDRPQGRRRRRASPARPRRTPPRCITRACWCRRSRSREEGRPLPDIERIILTNSRQPALVRGDIHAQIAVTQMGAARVKELCERFGARTVTDAFAAILKGAADELRTAIAKLPEGSSAAEGLLDSDGVEVDKPLKLAVTVTIKDGIASFDFSEQRSAGAEARSTCGPPWSRPACSIR